MTLLSLRRTGAVIAALTLCLAASAGTASAARPAPEGEAVITDAHGDSPALVALKAREWLATGRLSRVAAGTVSGLPFAPYEVPEVSLAVGRPVVGGTTYRRLVQVATGAELREALAGLRSGTVIELAPGHYRGTFTMQAPLGGPVALVGARTAVVAARPGSPALRVTGSHVTLAGFSVVGSVRGVALTRSTVRQLDITCRRSAGITLVGPASGDVLMWDHLHGRNQQLLDVPAGVSQRGLAIGDRVHRPFVTGDGIDGRAVVVLPGPATYTLGTVLALEPQIAEIGAHDAVTLHASLFAARGAHLTISANDTPDLRLESDQVRHVSVQGYEGGITLGGGAGRMTVQSWNPASGSPDTSVAAGRAYVLEVRGRMDADRVDFSDLGYAEGTVSGVAWKGTAAGGTNVPARGTVTRSSFARNDFGAYTFDALGMHWAWNQLRHNIGYGLDPHDGSSEFVVEHNVADDNGTHGIIFSRGCRNNVIRHNTTERNGGAGIMVDDGHYVPGSSNARWRVHVPSDGTLVERNYLSDNTYGVVIEGGTDNQVRDNVLGGVHQFAVMVRGSTTSTTIANNTIERAGHAAFLIYGRAARTHVLGNEILDAHVGVVLRGTTGTLVRGNRFHKVTMSAVEASGSNPDSVVVGNTFDGTGSQPFRIGRASGLASSGLASANDLSAWLHPAPGLFDDLGRGMWLVVLLAPVALGAVARLRPRSRQRPWVTEPAGHPRPTQTSEDATVPARAPVTSA